MKCVAQNGDHRGVRYCVCPRRVLNNLHPGKIFYDGAYHLRIGSKSTFTADVLELMQLIALISLLCGANLACSGGGGWGQGMGGIDSSLGLNILFSPNSQ